MQRKLYFLLVKNAKKNIKICIRNKIDFRLIVKNSTKLRRLDMQENYFLFHSYKCNKLRYATN